MRKWVMVLLVVVVGMLLIVGINAVRWRSVLDHRAVLDLFTGELYYLAGMAHTLPLVNTTGYVLALAAVVALPAGLVMWFLERRRTTK